MRLEEKEPVKTLDAIWPLNERAGGIVIRGEKPALRCEICHQADLFNPETGECQRCANLVLSDLLQDPEPHYAAAPEQSTPGSFRFRLLMSGLCAGSVIAANHFLLSGTPTIDVLIAIFFFLAAGAAYRLNRDETDNVRWCEACDARIDSETDECQRCAGFAQGEEITPLTLAQAVGDAPASEPNIRARRLSERMTSGGIRVGATLILSAFGGVVTLCATLALFGSRHPIVWLAPLWFLLSMSFLAQRTMEARRRADEES